MPHKDLNKRKEYQKEYHKKYSLSEKSFQNKKEKAKIRKDKIRNQIDEFKILSGCKDCGYNKHAYVLDFDHLKDKEDGISEMLHRSLSWDRIKKEIEKCEVVCSNCHRIRTYNRRIKKI